MKKIVVFILAFLYLAVSSGIAMEIHYCMGEQAGVEFFGSETDRCGKCGMKEKKGGCCSNESKFYKVDDAHQQATYDHTFDYTFSVADLHPVVVVHCSSNANKANFTCTIPPPPDIHLSAYRILFSVFRI